MAMRVIPVVPTPPPVPQAEVCPATVAAALDRARGQRKDSQVLLKWSWRKRRREKKREKERMKH